MSRLTASLAFVALAAIAGAPSAAAQDRWQEQVETQLMVLGEFLIDEGYQLTHVSTDRELDEDGTFDAWVDLQGGVEYAIIGVCDEDCADLDLELLSSEAETLVSDYELDDFPMLSFVPQFSSRFRIHVFMADCSSEPCSWGVGIFGR